MKHCACCLQKHCDLGESYVYKEKITWRKIGRVLSTPSNLCCIGQGLPGSLPWGVILTFFNDYLVQEQHRDIGIAASVSPMTISLLACESEREPDWLRLMELEPVA